MMGVSFVNGIRVMTTFLKARRRAEGEPGVLQGHVKHEPSFRLGHRLPNPNPNPRGN